MRLLFLRGQVPYDFHPERLKWKDIDLCEDMWTVLAERMSRILGSGELWYWGAKKKFTVKTDDGVFQDVRYSGNFSEAGRSNTKFPDIIFARGGFKQYDKILSNYPGAFKIYYGAGTRIVPQPDMFKDFDMFLTDSPHQVDMVQSWVYNNSIKAHVMVLPKPAAPMFKPMPEVEKDFDVCFPANDFKFKGHGEMFQALSGSGLKVLNIGVDSLKQKREAAKYNVNIKFAGWHRREKVVELINMCRVGLVMTHKHRDSAPRVIPELLACDLPVVVTNYVNISDLHVNYKTGMTTKLSKVASTINKVIEERKRFTPREFYDENLSVDVVGDHMVKAIRSLTGV